MCVKEKNHRPHIVPLVPKPMIPPGFNLTVVSNFLQNATLMKKMEFSGHKPSWTR